MQDVFNQQQPGLAAITNTVQGTIPGLSGNQAGWNPAVGQSQGYYGDVLAGKYLDPSTNPALQGMIDKTGRDVTNQVNSQFSLAGRYGSDAHGGALTRGLADAENNLLYQNYGAERANQGQAAGAVNDASNQSLAALLQAAGVGAELPYTGTNNLSSALSALFGGGTQTSKTSGGIGGILGGVGGLLSGGGALGMRA
ncbi:hypothetical protein TomTYG75_07200 [Sphingobium sp. TomTYG75]